MTVHILTGDCRQLLRTLPEKSVHCCVTSPPYWGLRDYGVGGQIGLEGTYPEYVSALVDVFREVKRVLRDDGTLWLNLGDCYATGAGRVGDCPGGGVQGSMWAGRPAPGKTQGAGYRGTRGKLNSGKAALRIASVGPATQPNRMPQAGLKPKDLVGIPWRVAFALQEEGWWLRRDIIWHKANPMPESVQDRPTTSHEYIFLLSKSERYFYDAEAIMEPSSPDSHARAKRGRSQTHKWADGGPGGQTIARLPPSAGRLPGVNPKADYPSTGGPRSKQNASFSAAISGDVAPMRNKRSVWTVASEPFSDAHFATFPTALIEPCILAGTQSGEVIIDPFGGAGTTGLVADRLGRDAILIELNPEYAAMAERRIKGDAGMFVDVRRAAE
ncbi:MAG: site-specific DNA-methyltransferase [Telmatospirillum sp.]|nr:site-specific DNA-methyltransferase [Telmatospirillum sp.]